MRKTIITTCLIGSLIIILDSTRVVYSLLIFLISGVIPGTNVLVPANIMLVGVGVIASIIVLRIFVAIANSLQNDNNTGSRIVIKNRSNLRRFSNI